LNALRLFGPGDLRIVQDPDPVLTPGRVLVQVKAVGICGSDLHWFRDGAIGDARLSSPLVLGHEAAGIIQTGSKAGLLVAIDPCIPCGVCEFCQEGSPNLCPNQLFAGHSSQDGALTQLIAWPEHLLYPLPTAFSPAEGAALEPLGVALYAVDQAALRPGCTVGVFGCGPIGLLIIRLARLAGALDVVATDRLPHRLEAARSYGATECVLAGEHSQEWSEGLVGTGRRGGLDVVFEAAGQNGAVETAVGAVRAGGRVILVGIPEDDRTSFMASAARRKGLTLIVSRRMKHTYPRAIRLVEQGLVDLKPLLTHHFPLSQGQAGFQLAARREGLKVTILPD
jgi:L-iditol 2-dehydrogenase